MKLLCVLLFDMEQKFAVDWCTSDSKNIKPYKTRVYLKTVLRSPHNVTPLNRWIYSGADREARYTSAERDHEREACEEKLICPFCQ